MAKDLTESVCPTCGATSKEKEFVDFFCIDCHHKHHKEQLSYEIPKDIFILQCKKCGILKIRKWYGSLREIAADIPSLFKGTITDVNVISLSERQAMVEFVIDGEKTVKEIPVKLHRTLCDDCTKIARGYFEAILQIRGDKVWVERMRLKVEKELLQNTFITKEEEFKYGVDIYIGSNHGLRATLRNLDLRAKTSERLHTAKDGRKLYRVTFLLRQPEAPVEPQPEE